MDNLFLKEKITKEAQIIDNNIIKVDHFLNHQIDVILLDKVASIFYDYFKDKNINKIVTIEASGIAIACSVGRLFKVPVVFGKKVDSKQAKLPIFYSSEIYSYTKKVVSNVVIDKRFLGVNDNILIIDDFLANGQASLGLINIVEQSKATIKGVGIVIEKSFQNGSELLKEKNIDLLSIIKIKEIVNNKLVYVGD